VLQDERVVAIERELVQELSDTRDELTRLRQELTRLRGTGIESLDSRELAQLRIELEKGQRRVRDAELRHDAEERVASQTNSFLCPICCELMCEPVMAVVITGLFSLFLLRKHFITEFF
jgi:hypothetical protein